MGANQNTDNENNTHGFGQCSEPGNPCPQPDLMVSMVENTEEMLLALDREGQIIYANPAVLRVGGYDRADLSGRFIGRIFELTEEQKNQIIECGLEGRHRNMETSVVRKDGSSFPVQVSLSPLRTSTGRRGTVVIAVDISTFKKTLEERARLVTAVEQSAESIVVTDKDGTVQYVNPAFGLITGYSCAEVVGRNINLIESDQHDRSFFASMQEILKRGEIWQGRLVIKGRENSLCETETTISPVKNKRGEITNYVSVQRDVTHEVRLEKQLRQAQKMEAIGTLAGGIAHDFNNLLMGIQGNTSLSLLEVGPGSALYKNLKKIEQLVQNGVDLTKQLLGFARGGKYEVNLIDINELIQEQNLMFGRTNKEVVFRGEFDPDLWAVEVDQGQIEQVIMNLYLNAVQAMSGGGTLTVKTENISIDKDLFRPYRVKAGKYIKISVTDTGVGIPEKTLQRIFDPFFTTKEMGRGTGLGLASVYGIVKNHDGFINVTSQIGKGTRFEIHLPASEKRGARKERPPEAFLMGKETVLLVDDEDVIIDVGERMLNKLGYHVITARSGIEALEVYKKNQDRVAIIIMDMVMPQMNGGETFDRIKAINPNAKVLLSSGYSITGQAAEILARGCNGFIQKPFNMQILSQHIRMVLDKK